MLVYWRVVFLMGFDGVSGDVFCENGKKQPAGLQSDMHGMVSNFTGGISASVNSKLDDVFI